MYVLSSLPSSQQSLAGGIFNTIIKIGTAIGLGISSSIYNAESTGGEALQQGWKPYEMVFWFCVACSGVGVLGVPFLTIRTQGGVESRDRTSNGKLREKSQEENVLELQEVPDKSS
jgi:hypothetical protein